MRNWLSALSLVWVSPLVCGAESAAPVRVERLRFMTHAEAGQPSVTLHRDTGGFIVTWQERTEDGASLWYATIDRGGREVARRRIAAGKNWFINWADFPSLAVLANGDWVTHYFEKSEDSPYAYDIRIVRSPRFAARCATAGSPCCRAHCVPGPYVSASVRIAWIVCCRLPTIA